MSPAAPQLQADSLPLSHQGSPTELYKYGQNGEFYIIYILPWKQKRKKEHQDSTVDVNLVGLQFEFIKMNPLPINMHIYIGIKSSAYGFLYFLNRSL